METAATDTDRTAQLKFAILIHHNGTIIDSVGILYNYQCTDLLPGLTQLEGWSIFKDLSCEVKGHQQMLRQISVKCVGNGSATEYCQNKMGKTTYNSVSDSNCSLEGHTKSSLLLRRKQMSSTIDDDKKPVRIVQSQSLFEDVHLSCNELHTEKEPAAFCPSINKCDHEINGLQNGNTQSNKPKQVLQKCLHAKKLVCLSEEASVMECIVKTIKRSQLFFKKYYRLINQCPAFHRRNEPIHTPSQRCTSDVAARVVVLVDLHRIPPDEIDHKWCYRIAGLVRQKVLFEDALSWLNTLGGGYSALGDYFHHCAAEAGKISVKQFKIALGVGDPGLAARCRLYYAQSVMQQGYLRKAKYIIRAQYWNAKTDLSHDVRLLAMCEGIWMRLRYLYQKRGSLDHK